MTQIRVMCEPGIGESSAARVVAHVELVPIFDEHSNRLGRVEPGGDLESRHVIVAVARVQKMRRFEEVRQHHVCVVRFAKLEECLPALLGCVGRRRDWFLFGGGAAAAEETRHVVCGEKDSADFLDRPGFDCEKGGNGTLWTVNMATKRADLAERKRCLDAVLPRGHRAQYWDAVERFLRAKSTKAELEAAARSLLGSEATHYQLHNEFFLVLLHNAQCPELPRAPVESGAVELAKGKRHAPLDDLIKQSSAKRRHGGADAGGKVSKSSATAAAAAAALAKRNLGAVGAASFLSRLPRRLRYLAASHLPMSSLGPITIFSNSKEDVLAALPAYMFAAPRFHAYDRALPMYSLPLRIRAPQLCVSASSLAVHYSANQMQSASPTKPDPTDTCDVAGEGVDSSAPRLCSSQSLLAAWFSSMNRAGIANELPDSAQIRSRYATALAARC